MTDLERFKPGTLVLGPFYTTDTDEYRQGCGVVVKRTRELWTQTERPYIPVKIIAGDRCHGGYRPENLIALTYTVA